MSDTVQTLKVALEEVSKLARTLKEERDDARNKLADALQEIDLRTLDFERIKQERDEVIRQRDETNESSVFTCNFYYAEKLKAERERDEVRVALAESQIESLEQVRLLGIGKSNEAKLISERDEAREQAERYLAILKKHNLDQHGN